jgi:cytoskeleton protein RodZ
MDNTSAVMTKEPDRQPQGAARVGMEMRLVRERLGWRLTDVAAELRIRLPYLEAIERGELSALPGAAYQTGFVRTYSQALGLDGDEILRRFRAEGTGFVPKAELSFLAPVPDRAVPTGAIVLLGVVLVLVGYGLWYRHTEQEAQLAAQIPAVPTELAPLAVPPKPPEVAPPAKAASATAPTQAETATTASAAPTAAPVSGVSATPAPQTATPQQAATSVASPGQTGSSTTALPAPPEPAPAPPSATAKPAASPATTQPASPATAATPAATMPAVAAQPQKIIQATGDTWIEVQDAKGAIVFSKTMHQGDSWPVPNLPGLVLTAGNAGATLIAGSGKPSGPLGATGTVVRKLALTPPAPGSAGTSAATQPPAPHAASNGPSVTGGVEGPSANGSSATN